MRGPQAEGSSRCRCRNSPPASTSLTHITPGVSNVGSGPIRAVLTALDSLAGYTVRGCRKLKWKSRLKGELQMAKSRKATAADADICMKLYDLRREAEMRKARNFVNFQFQPQGADDVLKLMQALGTQENAWVRQVFSFWENASSLILNDVVHPDLFFAWNGEMIFVYAKFKPFLKELRKQMDN